MNGHFGGSDTVLLRAVSELPTLLPADSPMSVSDSTIFVRYCGFLTLSLL